MTMGGAFNNFDNIFVQAYTFSIIIILVYYILRNVAATNFLLNPLNPLNPLIHFIFAKY
jgi:hypothetical protein